MEQLETIGYFINSKGEKSTDLMLRNPKFFDDVIQPKKARNAYQYFQKDFIKLIKENNPDLKQTEVMKLAG